MQDLERPEAMYRKLGAKLVVGMPFKDQACSDTLLLPELPPASDKDGRRALARLQARRPELLRCQSAHCTNVDYGGKMHQIRLCMCCVGDDALNLVTVHSGQCSAKVSDVKQLLLSQEVGVHVIAPAAALQAEPLPHAVASFPLAEAAAAHRNGGMSLPEGSGRFVVTVDGTESEEDIATLRVRAPCSGTLCFIGSWHVCSLTAWRV